MKRISLIGSHRDAELRLIHDTLARPFVVGDRSDVEALCGALVRELGEHTPEPATLDLIGHSLPGSSLLQLGTWVIDGASGVVTAFFRELADNDILARLGIEAIRLLGCNTAVTGPGRATLGALAEVTGVEVYGTRGLVLASQYGAQGFTDDWSFLLVGSRDLGDAPAPAQPPPGTTTTRTLDIDALPASTLGEHAESWPQLVATRDAATAVLRLVDRHHGATMPGLLSQPVCELLLPSSDASRWHRVQVMLDHRFVRVYADGPSAPGVLYPVVDAHALQALCQSLAQRTPIA